MADNNGSGQASARSRWHRLGCWIWFRIIVLVLVLSTLTAYTVEVWRCSSFEPTGDALYDRYAQAVISRQKWLLFHGGKHHPTYLPDSLLAQWESDFGSDPRYWQLRYFCARYKGAYMSNTFVSKSKRFWINLSGYRPWDTQPTEIEKDAWEHLQEGVDRGAANWVTLEILERETGHLHSKANNDDMDRLYVLGLDKVEFRKRTIELSTAQEQAELTRVTTLVDSDTSQAWPYYMRAHYWFHYGESELALADLKAGNAAPKNEIVRSFPTNFLLERVENGNQLGSNILAEAIAMVALGGDTTMIQELHLAACRLGVAKYNDNWEPIVASVLDSWLAHSLIVRYGQDITYRQRLAMMQVYNRTQEVQGYYRSRSDVVNQHLTNYPRLLALEKENNTSVSGIQHTMIASPNSNYFHLEMFLQQITPRLYYNRALWIQQQQHAGVVAMRPSFEQLEYLDLTTLEWPDEWGNPY